MKAKKILKPILILVILGVLAGGGYFFYTRLTEADSQGFILSGNIEVTESRMGFKISGRLIERLVDEGDDVTAGQLIAVLEPTDEALAVEQAQARLAQARARLDELERGYRTQEVRSAEADLQRARAAAEQARAQLDLAKLDYERYKALYQREVVSREEYDRYTTNLETTQQAYDEANSQIKRAKEQLSLLREGYRTEEIEQARAQYEAAQKSLEETQQRLSYTNLYAPYDGVVLTKAAEPGEYLTAGAPVVTVADLVHVWVRAYVAEPDLSKIRRGQKAYVTTDAYPDKKFPGMVGFISQQAEFTPKTVQTFEERVKLVYRIKVDLINPERMLKAGMPADVHFPELEEGEAK